MPVRRPHTMIFSVLVLSAAALAQPPAAPPKPADPPSPAAPTQPAKPDAPKPAAAAPSAADLMNKMAAAYKDAKSYRDQGKVVTVYKGSVAPTSTKPFSTLFVRPSQFRFEFSDKFPTGQSSRMVIWTDAAPTKAKRWWSIQPGVTDETLDLAIASATGVSSGAAHMVPTLLLPDDLTGSTLAKAPNPKLLGDEDVDGSPCHKLQVDDVRGGPITIWIDQKTFLLRKIFQVMKLPSVSAESTTTYKPELNPQIKPDEFKFDPPKSE